MPELEITPHPERQQSYAELRAEFRASALANLRDQFQGRHPLGWNMLGDPIAARDRYTASEWCYEMLKHLDSPVAQSFDLDLVPDSLWTKLCDLARESLLHDSATWDDSVAGVTDHDAPACAPVSEMTDDELCSYIDSSIKDSENG